MEWLGITEDHIHVTNSGRDTDLTGRSCKVCSPSTHVYLLSTDEG